MVRNFSGLSPGFCLPTLFCPRSQRLGLNAALVVLNDTCESPQRALIPVGLSFQVCGRVASV